MPFRLRGLLSFNSDSNHTNIVNSNEHRTCPIYRASTPDNYANLNIPRIEVDTIYKIGTFDFIKAYSVKIHEEGISFQSGLQTIAMIKQNSI